MSVVRVREWPSQVALACVSRAVWCAVDGPGALGGSFTHGSGRDAEGSPSLGPEEQGLLGHPSVCVVSSCELSSVPALGSPGFLNVSSGLPRYVSCERQKTGGDHATFRDQAWEVGVPFHVIYLL